MENVRIEAIDLHIASEELLDLYFIFNDILRKEKDPDEPLPSRELRIKHVREKDPHSDEFRWIAYTANKDKIIGMSIFARMNESVPAYEENKHFGQIDVRVIPEYRRKGIGTNLLRYAVQKAAEFDIVTTIFGDISLECGEKFATEFNGKLSLAGAENRLYVADANLELLKQWRDEGRLFGKQNNVQLQFFEECPNDIIDEYTTIYSETMNQQPLGDFDGKIVITPKTRREEEERHKRTGTKWYTMITRESDGSISGLTEMMYITELPHKAFQNLTGVKKEYRGRSLGKWLKAELFFWIIAKYPNIKYIVTGNATSNAPMLSINERMGFKEFKANSMFVFQKTDLLSHFSN